MAFGNLARTEPGRSPTSESWESGDSYESYVGRWSRPVAVEVLDWLGVAPGRRWLDVGCGTGALSAAVLERCDPLAVVGVDPSESHVAWSAAHVDDPRARFVVGDATRLPPGTVDVVVSGLVLNFVPDLDAALAAMRDRAPDGIVAAYVWDYAEGMELMRHFWNAAVALDPAAAELDEGVRFPICRRDRLEDLWWDSGFVDVETRAIEVPTVFSDFDDYWTPFLGGQGPAPGYAMSLDEGRRSELRDRILAGLPVAGDGTISLIARAWAVSGRVA
jgi:SAM-dependent methyltransferase